MSNRGYLGVKRMGELDSSVFQEACKRKYPEDIAEDKAAEICSLWDEYLRDPTWHPFKVVPVHGEHKVSDLWSLIHNIHLRYVSSFAEIPCYLYTSSLFFPSSEF